MELEPISFRGDREIWENFVKNLKIQNKNVWDVLRPFVEEMSRFNFIKAKGFIESSLREYENNKIIDQVIITKEVPQTDGTFTDIAIKEPLPKDIFEEQGITYPIMLGLGKAIATGEVNHLIKNILDDKKIKREKIEKSKLTLNFLSSEAMDIGDNPTILYPTEIMTHLYSDQNISRRIKFGRIEILDDSVKMISVPPPRLGKNKVIIFDYSSFIWSYIKRYNPINNNTEVLHIQLSHDPEKGKPYVFVKSTGKLDTLLPEKIRIYEILD